MTSSRRRRRPAEPGDVATDARAGPLIDAAVDASLPGQRDSAALQEAAIAPALRAVARPVTRSAHRAGAAPLSPPRRRAAGKDPRDTPRTEPPALTAAEAFELRAATAKLLQFAEAADTPLDQAYLQTAILAELRELISRVAHARDQAIADVLMDRPQLSSRRLGPALGLTRQRVDQLRRLAGRGSRTSSQSR